MQPIIICHSPISPYLAKILFWHRNCQLHVSKLFGGPLGSFLTSSMASIIQMLQERDRCVHSSCPSHCNGFYLLDAGSGAVIRVRHLVFSLRYVSKSAGLTSNQLPGDVLALCAGCQHPWYSHQGRPFQPHDPRYVFQKGGCSTTECGGFFAVCRPVYLYWSGSV